MDKQNMFNDDVHNDLKYEEFTLEGDPSDKDINRSVCTISESLVLAVDQIIRQRTAKEEHQPNKQSVMSNKNWGQEQKRRKEIHNGIDAVTLLKAEVNLEQST
jgi:hypothetical protein